VISSTRNPVFAKQKLSLSHSRGLVLPCVLFALLFARFPSPSRADSLEDAAHALALKVCAAARQQSLRVGWEVSPELSGLSSESLKKAFLSQLSACGMATSDNSDFPLLNIAIRVTASNVLLVASLENPGASPQVRMYEMRRDNLSISKESSRAPRFQRKLLWQQEGPLETAMEWYDPSSQDHLLFLVSQDFIVRLRSTNEVWTQVDSAELPKADRSSRLGSGDSTFMHGNPGAEAKLELLISRAGAPIYRKLCEFAPAGSLSLRCNDSYLGGKQLGIFSECGKTLWSLGTDNGDYAHRDRVLFRSPEAAEAQFPDDEGNSHSLAMPGPVLDISATVDLKAATAVVRNLSTGNYEVYRITLACTN
jgi:hypothetical protein